MAKYDYLVVGAGLYGAVFAHEARKAGKSVMVIDRRPNIAGNVYTEDVEGIHVHKYGAHIFHTNDTEVWNYVQQFATFNRFTNSPVANYHGELYSLPFNMYTFNRMWGVVTPEEAAAKIDEQKRDYIARKQAERGLAADAPFEPQNLEEQAISLIGVDIYEKLIKGYTEKQWGRPCAELPSFIIKRLPVRLTFDNNYFNALYQGIPVGGYTQMVANMLDGIEVELGVDYLAEKAKYDALAEKVVYTGAIDAYFGYQLGTLEYRSVRFETELLDQPNFQGNAAVNYTDREAADDQTMQMLKEWCDINRPELSELFTLVQEYRKWGKIKSTYIDGYLKFLNPVTGCVHPDFFALSTDTGRFNCQHPNAQNMPRKTNDPIGVRNFIKAPDGHLIISLDFSQIELRVGAFYLSQAGDDTMREVYLHNLDLHAKTTSVIFGVPYEQAHDKNSPNYKEHRTIAKNVNFGVFYGLFPRGLQKTLKFKAGIDRSFEECSEMIENLKEGYPGLARWQESVKAEAERRMYTQTWLGRRRYLPNIRSDNWGQKSFSERCAMNTPIQGTAADILKMAVARILNGLPEKPWLLPILQIHDELTFIIPEDKLSDAVSFVKQCMEAKPFPEFNMPLIAEASAGRTFGAMDELDG